MFPLWVNPALATDEMVALPLKRVALPVVLIRCETTRIVKGWAMTGLKAVESINWVEVEPPSTAGRPPRAIARKTGEVAPATRGPGPTSGAHEVTVAPSAKASESAE